MNVNDGQVALTGVGSYDGVWIAPPNPEARYNDDGYTKPDEDLFTLRRKSANEKTSPFEKRGFAIHDACWQLLGEAFKSPDSVPLDRVFQVLDSFLEIPGYEYQASWGRGYGVDDDEYFPWELCSKLLRLLQDEDRPPNAADPVASDFRQNTHTAREASANRDHILKCVQRLVRIVELDRQDVGQSMASPWNNAPEPDDDRWLTVAGGLEGVSPTFFGFGCREFFHHRVAVPEDISRVSVSTVEVGPFSYVSGVSLSTSSGQTITLGYMGPRDKEECTHLNPPGLKGLNIAVGISGIHAIQCVGSESTGPADWLGCPEKAPMTRRLGSADGIVGLRFGFDGFRLVSIAAVLKANGVTADDDDSSENTADRQLKNSALWYPYPPPDRAKLNGELYHPLQSHLLGFNPMFWTRFGGPGGIYLKHLTKISCYYKQVLVFEYNRDDIPKQCRMFGRRPKLQSPYATSVHFDIDGPGGERIVGVNIRHKVWKELEEPYFTYEDLGSVEIFTSLGNSCYFAFDDEEEGDEWTQTVKESRFLVKKGMPITGFYGAQNPTAWLAGLGIMTEPEN
ncbi:hypothetical protein B0T21DRAFT_379058 [Apiosordaria backusii]|uniref:DUF7600 domain-containing protein n=1 Tax=Apiosordaria backusii TaxID=314023 RepID=A0AA40DFQ4_9PEZI|nr:hypothetical protein B0T21DRAFT_379058 [Apiosordaria backusii]